MNVTSVSLYVQDTINQQKVVIRQLNDKVKQQLDQAETLKERADRDRDAANSKCEQIKVQSCIYSFGMS